jgi:peptidoglycan/LPS O-acetylase OafA/YrhL
MRPDAIVPQILNVHLWVGQGLTWNFPAWTLSGEMAAYLLFALLLATVANKSWRFIATLFIILVSGAIFATELGPREDYNVISLARCFVGFFAGYALFDIWRWRSVQSANAATAIEVIAVLLLMLSVHARFDGAAYFLNFPIMALLVWVFASGKGVLSKAIANPVLIWLGKVSFSLYMIHAVIKIYIGEVFNVLERFTDLQFFYQVPRFVGDANPARLIDLGSTWANTLLLAGDLGLVFVAAELLFRYVELPTRHWSKGVSSQLAQPGGLAALGRLIWGPRRARPAAENIPPPH